MPIDPRISLGVQQLQLQDPLAQYAKVAHIQNAQQANALNQLKMQEMQREISTRNALNAAYQQAYDPELQQVNENALLGSLATQGFGAQIPDIQKGIMEAKTAQVGYDKAQQELAAARMKEARNLLPNVTTPEAYAQWREYAAKQMPGIAAMLPQQYSPDNVQRLMVEADKWLELNKPTTQVINRSGRTDIVRVPGAYDTAGAPTTVGTYADVQLPTDVEAQKSRIARAGAPQITNISGAQETAFEKGLGEKLSGKATDSLTAAEDAVAIIQTNSEARRLLDEGMITGAGANLLVNFTKALNQAGISTPYDDAAKNTQVFAATVGNNVGRIIKLFGAGTGLSDADRQYAMDIAGGNVTLDKEAIRKLLDINDRAARRAISVHNKKYGGLASKTPIKVEMPPEYKKPDIVTKDEEIPGVRTSAPSAAANAALQTPPASAAQIQQLPANADEELKKLWQYMTPEDRKIFME